MSIPVKVGDPVRLLLQMTDGEASLPLVVKATLRDETGLFLTEVTLSHVGLGLFKNQTYVFTTEKEVIAQYRIFQADGTTIHPDFEFAADRFVKNESGSGSGGEGSGSGVVIGNEFVLEVEND